MPKYAVYRNHSSSPLAQDSSLWELFRFIAYLFKSGDYKTLTITKEENNG